MQTNRMFNRVLAHVVIAVLVSAIVTSAGCSKSSPSAPTPVAFPAPLPMALSMTSVFPATGVNFEPLKISGTGFLPGATLTLDDVEVPIRGLTSTVINAIAPEHDAGPVDVSVTNPGGDSVTLNRAYTFEVVVLTANPRVVEAGGELTVSWVVPKGRSGEDWISLYRVGDLNRQYGWYEYTLGSSTGTFTLAAPAQPGEYEFRYMLDFNAAARSTVVTVRD